MSKIRIYELAKELGVDNKTALDKVQELGIPGKNSHSHSLSDEEADQVRRAFIRSAVGDVTERTIGSSLDSKTGQTSLITERRSGNVIRRRRSSEAEVKERETVAPVSVPEEIVPVIAEPEVQVEQMAEAPVAVEIPIVAEPEVAQVEAPVHVERPAAPQPEPVRQMPVIIDEPPREKIGPRILGRIELNLPTRTAPRGARKPEPQTKKGGILTAGSISPILVEDEDSDADGKSKKKGRVKEYSVGQLVDFEGRRRKQRKFDDDSFRDSEDDKSSSAAKVQQKRVVKMSSKSITVGDLANQMSIKSGQVIAKLMQLGVMATINQRIDIDTATILSDEFGFTIEFSGYDEADVSKIEGIDDTSRMASRPPVVTVMGHVDHGKTSLLDKIRKTSVAAKEHGGITQHIGAYVVQTKDSRKITFIDTPGHAAFTSMRARGAKITDIVILVVAADDGVMPQTIEALNHAKAAEVPIIVAMNKMDKHDANPERLKTQLAEKGLQPEEWGGDAIFVPVSAVTGKGIEELLESVLLVSEMKELKANPDCRVKGTVIEVRTEMGRGTVSTVLVQAGTLKVGDIFVAGANSGKVRSMMDDNGKPIKEAGPSVPVEITGFAGNPEAGDEFITMEDEYKAKELAQHRLEIVKARQHELTGGPISLEEFAKRAGQEQAVDLNIIIKADVHGSLEAVKKTVEDLSGNKVRVKVVHAAVGGVTESDVQLAGASRAIILGFNVRGEPRAMQVAESTNIEIRFYRIIYELVDDVKKAMSGLLAPVKEEVSLGRVEVRQTFMVPKIGMVAGCYVQTGTVERGAHVRLLRDNIVVYEGKIGTLRRFKDDVKEVQTGYECGMGIAGYNDIKVGDVVEVFKLKEVAQSLD